MFTEDIYLPLYLPLWSIVQGQIVLASFFLKFLLRLNILFRWSIYWILSIYKKTANILPLQEVLRRENQGLKVHPVDGSSVFSMTGTYFWFVLSVLSGLIKKKRLRPVCSFAVTPPVQSNNFKIQNPPVVGWAACADDPFPPQESKRK